MEFPSTSTACSSFPLRKVGQLFPAIPGSITRFESTCQLHRIPVDNHLMPCLRLTSSPDRWPGSEPLQVHQLQVFTLTPRRPLITAKDGQLLLDPWEISSYSAASSRSAARARGLSVMIRSRSTTPPDLAPCQSPKRAPKRKAARMKLGQVHVHSPRRICPAPGDLMIPRPV